MKIFKRTLCLLVALVMIAFSLQLQVFAKVATTGNIANVIVCVRFADDTATDTFGENTDEILMLYNDTTDLYAPMNYDYSFKAYINEISRGMLNVENTFPQYDGSVITPLTLSSTLQNSDDSTILTEIIAAFNSGAITLPSGKYDYRTSGIFDNLTVLIQGTVNEASSGVMWPHKSVSNVTTRMNNGYYIGNYNFINTYSLLDSMTMQGTVSHEFMHTIGFPDLYRQSGLTGNPVGRWDIMAADSMYQQYPLSYMRYKMGWVPMKSISKSGTYTIDPVSDPDSDRILYKLETPLSNTEFFVIEFRYKNPNYGIYDSKRFEAKIPSSGMLIYRVNNAVEYQTNFVGEDYLYVFRPDETSLTASDGDMNYAAIDPTKGETSYGKADMDAAFTEQTIFYSDGRNSGIVIDDISYSSDGKQMTFTVTYPDYSSMDLWNNVGAPIETSTSITQGAADSTGKKYVLSSGMTNDSFVTNLFYFDGEDWVTAANTLSNIYDAYIQIFNDEVYMIYSNSSWYPTIAKLQNGKWVTVVTDKSCQYANSLQLFTDGNTLYCGWAKDGTDLIIKKLNGSTLSAVNSSLTASYFSNPTLIASQGYIYALYSDFFGSDRNTKLKKLNVSTGAWTNISISNPVSMSNVHRTANNNGELWFLAAGPDATPVVISVKSNGQVVEETVPTSVTNFINIGIDVSDNGTLCVGLFTPESDSEVLMLEKGEWNALGSRPCDSIQTADMFIFENTAYVASATSSSGTLVIREKELPQKPVSEIIAREGTDITVTDGYIIGVPLNAVDLSLYLDTTEDGTYTFTGTGTGAEVHLYSADNVLLKVYTVVVRGDVNADNKIDGMDCVYVDCIINGMSGLTQTEIYAADADGNGITDENDYSLIFNSGLYL